MKHIKQLLTKIKNLTKDEWIGVLWFSLAALFFLFIMIFIGFVGLFKMIIVTLGLLIIVCFFLFLVSKGCQCFDIHFFLDD